MRTKNYIFGLLLVALMGFWAAPMAMAVEHNPDTYNENEDDTGLVAASVWWTHEDYLGQQAHRAHGAHTSIGLPGTGKLFVCGSSPGCGNLVKTCAIPENGDPLGTDCGTTSSIVWLGCRWAWGQTTNTAGLSADSVPLPTEHC